MTNCLNTHKKQVTAKFILHWKDKNSRKPNLSIRDNSLNANKL